MAVTVRRTAFQGHFVSGLGQGAPSPFKIGRVYTPAKSVSLFWGTGWGLGWGSLCPLAVTFSKLKQQNSLKSLKFIKTLDRKENEKKKHVLNQKQISGSFFTVFDRLTVV